MLCVGAVRGALRDIVYTKRKSFGLFWESPNDLSYVYIFPSQLHIKVYMNINQQYF